MQRSLERGFENVDAIGDLISLEAGFTGFTLLSPAAPTIPDYVALRNCLLANTCDYLDNYFEFIANPVHAGATALRAHAEPVMAQADPALDAMVTTKASIQTDLAYAVSGDTARLSGWFYIESGMPFSLIDFETTLMAEWLAAPGPRVILDDEQALAVQLKGFDPPPTYSQSAGSKVAFPTQAWVEVEYVLSAESDGVIRVWQDDQLVIDQTGPNILVPQTVLNSFEFGITGNSVSTTLLVDDLSFQITRE